MLSCGGARRCACCVNALASKGQKATLLELCRGRPTQIFTNDTRRQY